MNTTIILNDMMIHTNTKIAAIIKHHPGALEAIISLHPGFEKLRNPLLRKLMAGRTTIAMAAKIGGFSVDKFFETLLPLGFEIDREILPEANTEKPKLPAFFNSLTPDQIVDLDVRPVIEAGKDPLTSIVDKAKNLREGEVLKIINSFEPTPLISLLKKQGFDSFTDVVDEQLVETYFYRTGPATVITVEENSSQGWDELLEKFKDKMEVVDVRNLEMPQPMMTILSSIENLADDKALFVYHKRIPVFLLPELKDRNLDYRIREIAPGQVRLLIFKN